MRIAGKSGRKSHQQTSYHITSRKQSRKPKTDEIVLHFNSQLKINNDSSNIVESFSRHILIGMVNGHDVSMLESHGFCYSINVSFLKTKAKIKLRHNGIYMCECFCFHFDKFAEIIIRIKDSII